MTYEEYKLVKADYNKKLDDLSDKLNSFPKNHYGLITDEAKKTTDYIYTKNQYNSVFQQYRNFNSLKESKVYAKRMYNEKLKK